MNQTERIKRHLEEYGTITSKQAFQSYGCTRLSARIYELRHIHGLQIEDDRKTEKNRFGESVSYSIYRLKKLNTK